MAYTAVNTLDGCACSAHYTWIYHPRYTDYAQVSCTPLISGSCDVLTANTSVMQSITKTFTSTMRATLFSYLVYGFIVIHKGWWLSHNGNNQLNLMTSRHPFPAEVRTATMAVVLNALTPSVGVQPLQNVCRNMIWFTKAIISYLFDCQRRLLFHTSC